MVVKLCELTTLLDCSMIQGCKICDKKSIIIQSVLSENCFFLYKFIR